MENWCYSELNRACRFKDRSKLKTLGPWAYALGEIVGYAQEGRSKEKYDCSKPQDLWRGGGMTKAEIKEYEQMVQGSWSHWYQKTFNKKNNYIRLFGYTSCSLEKSAAL